ARTAWRSPGATGAPGVPGTRSRASASAVATQKLPSPSPSHCSTSPGGRSSMPYGGVFATPWIRSSRTVRPAAPACVIAPPPTSASHGTPRGAATDREACGGGHGRDGRSALARSGERESNGAMEPAPTSDPAVVDAAVGAPWSVPPDDVLAALGSEAGGLSGADAATRLAEVGPNRLPPPRRDPLWKRVLVHFDDVLIYILLVSAVLKAILGDWVDFTVILAVAVINAAIGFVQEGRAESA